MISPTRQRNVESRQHQEKAGEGHRDGRKALHLNILYSQACRGGACSGKGGVCFMLMGKVVCSRKSAQTWLFLHEISSSLWSYHTRDLLITSIDNISQ